MKNSLLFIGLALFVIGCQEEKKAPEPTVVKGTIAHVESDTLAIIQDDFEQKIALNNDGSFADTLKLPNEGYYTLRVNNEITTLYLSPEKTHAITLDTEQFDESLEYSGENAPINNYLAGKFLLSEKIDISPSTMRSLPEDSLIMLAEKNQKEYMALLEKSAIKDTAFVNLEKEALGYKNHLVRQEYALYSENGYYSLEEEAPSTDKFITKKLDLDNAEAYANFSDYQRLVSLDFYLNTREQPGDTVSYVNKATNYIENLESENIKNNLLNSVAYRIRPGNEDNEEIYNAIMAISGDAEFKEELSKKYEIVKSLKKGNPSPTFTYENYEGGETSLESLQGKYVYIDVWATWCGPCLRQIPDLLALEEEYKDRNIHFVSISIDTDDAYDKWRAMIEEKELGGIQLIADNNWESEFIQNYAISGIPRFILLDPQGNIVSANAPRPTQPEELNKLFNGLEI